MSAVLPTLDLFGAPTAPPQIVRLDRSTDRERPCCRNLAIVLPRPDTPPGRNSEAFRRAD